MKTVSIALISLMLLSMLLADITACATTPSQNTPAVNAPSISIDAAPQEVMANTSLILSTNNAAPHVGQVFTLSGRLSRSNGSSTGVEALELYRSVNGGKYTICWMLTTQTDGSFSQNFTYNKAAILKYYTYFDETTMNHGARSNIITVTVTNAK